MRNNRGHLEEIREAAEADLYTFAKLVNPQRLYGEVHKQVFRWLMDDHESQLLLLPRGHMKSHCMAVWAAWWVTKNPETTIMYLSATTDLAEKQLYAIKQIFESDTYRLYWPEMTERDEGKREKWSATEIMVDHPKRKLEGTRDPTIRAVGLSTTTTGAHCDVLVPDDVVVPENAYTEEGRRKVAAAMSQMSSILNTGGITKACGTRYHPRDQYSLMRAQTVQIYDDNDEIIGEEPVWSIFEGVVETNGVFLWPREVRADGKAFGFDRRELSKISAKYTDRTQFFAQYYNDPNDPESNMISESNFRYYEPSHLKREGGRWYMKDKNLNVYAAIDFAFSKKKKADYTAIVVIGIDPEGFIYVLDIDRFKTDKLSDYFDKVERMHSKWQFKRLRAEVTVAQVILVNDLKDRLRQNGMNLVVDEHRPTRHEGTKEERVASILEPRYNNGTILHFRGGYIPSLEEEVLLARPPHDDIKDSLSSAIEIAVAPSKRRMETGNVVKISSRFGGVAFR